MERNQISFAKHIDISALLSTAILLLGAILAAGSARNGSSTEFALARINP